MEDIYGKRLVKDLIADRDNASASKAPKLDASNFAPELIKTQISQQLQQSQQYHNSTTTQPTTPSLSSSDLQLQPTTDSMRLVTPPLQIASPQVLQTQSHQIQTITQPVTTVSHQMNTNILNSSYVCGINNNQFYYTEHEHVLLSLFFIANLQQKFNIFLSLEKLSNEINCGLPPPGIILVPSLPCCRTIRLYAPKLGKDQVLDRIHKFYSEFLALNPQIDI